MAGVTENVSRHRNQSFFPRIGNLAGRRIDFGGLTWESERMTVRRWFMSLMALQNILIPERIVMRLRSVTKPDAIRELLDVLDRAGMLGDRAAAEQAVFEREAMLSTGMENGVAVPHGKTASVNRAWVAVGLAPDGIPFDSSDGSPARILALVVSPAGDTGAHLGIMAGLSKALRQDRVREAVLAASRPEDVIQALTHEAVKQGGGCGDILTADNGFRGSR